MTDTHNALDFSQGSGMSAHHADDNITPCSSHGGEEMAEIHRQQVNRMPCRTHKYDTPSRPDAHRAPGKRQYGEAQGKL